MTPHLVSQLTDLISVPHALHRMIRCMVATTLGSVAACLLVVQLAGVRGGIEYLLCVYGILVGVLLGTAVGCLRILRQSLGSLEAILRIVLETTARVAHDYRRLEAGAVTLPSTGQLVRQVYQDVAYPALQQAILQALPWLGRPLFILYRCSLGMAVARILPRQEAESCGKQAAAIHDGLASVAQRAEAIQDATTARLDKLAKIAQRIRAVTLGPLWTLLVVAAVAAAVPIATVCLYVANH